MANMTFKANLLPDNASGQKELGSSTKKWKIYAEEIDVTGDAHLHNETYADSITVGDLVVTGSTNLKTSDIVNDSGFITAANVPAGVQPTTTLPKMDGTAAIGTETKYAKGDHVHPSDTTKVDKITGKGLSTNDFTTALKDKLDGISAGAEVNVQSDWNQTTTTADDYIKNKPSIPTKVSDLTNDRGYITSADVPEGASASVTDPLMDGTAATGTSTAFARGDHVHPTDTSRAASDHTHGNITNDGDITATAPTIANGDQLIINDHSASKITNGPTFDGTTTTKALTPKGTWETFNNYNLPLAANGTRGGIQIGYTQSEQNYPVQLSSEKAYVNVPWTDTKVTQAYSTTNDSYPLLLSAINGVTSTESREDTTAILNNQIYANPNTGMLTAEGLTTDSITFKNGSQILTNAINNFYFRVQKVQDNGSAYNPAQYINVLVATDKAVRPPTNYSEEIDLGATNAKWNNIYAKTVTLSQNPVNALEAATKQYVDNAFAVNDAMIFKDVLHGGDPTTYTPAADRGHTYKVATAGKINGINVEVGDILICTNDSTAEATSSNVNTIKDNWVIVQTNLDGAVIGPAGGVSSGNVAVFKDSSGHVIKKGTVNTDNVVKTITFNGGTTPTLGDNISADDITNWSQGTLPSLSIATVSCDDITGWTAGSVTTAAVTNGVLTITNGTASSLSYTSREVGSASNWNAGALPSLSYTSRSIPNVTNIGTKATLSTESQSVITSIS